MVAVILTFIPPKPVSSKIECLVILVLYLLNHTLCLSEMMLMLLPNHSDQIVLEKRELPQFYSTVTLFRSWCVVFRTVRIDPSKMYLSMMEAKCLLGPFSDVVVCSCASALVLQHLSFLFDVQDFTWSSWHLKPSMALFNLRLLHLHLASFKALFIWTCAAWVTAASPSPNVSGLIIITL